MKKIVLESEKTNLLRNIPITDTLVARCAGAYVGVVHRADCNMWCIMSTTCHKLDIGYHASRAHLLAHSVKKGYTFHTVFGGVVDLEENKEVVHIDQVSCAEPIFVAEDGKLIGLVYLHEKKGWIVATAPSCGYFGYEDTLQDLIREGTDYGLEFYIGVGIWE